MRKIFITSIILILAGCQSKISPLTRPASKAVSSSKESTVPMTGSANFSTPQRYKVALLLPLTGAYGALGQEMLKSAEIAYFRASGIPFTLLIKDTQGTPEGTIKATQEVLKEGVSLILGPIFANEVKAMRPLITAQKTLVISFSNDDSVAGNGIFNLGLVPQDQVQALFDFIHSRGILNQDITALLPETPYGHLIQKVLTEEATATDPFPIVTIFYDPQDHHLRTLIEKSKTIKAKALFIPEGQPTLGKILRTLAYHDYDFTNVKILGTALWDAGNENNISNSLSTTQEPKLLNAWFAGPDPNDRLVFEQKFKQFHQKLPLRFATLGYAAIEIALDLLSNNPDPDTLPSILISRPFNGVEGSVRFLESGKSRRDMAILQVTPTGSIVINSGIKGVFSQVKMNTSAPFPQSVL